MYNPNEIDVLLEAQQILHENVLTSLLEWFKRKLQSIGEMFRAFKRKISGHNLSPEQRQAVAMAEKECRGIKGICNKGIASCKRGASAAAYAYKQSLPSHAKSMADYMARVKFHDNLNKKVGEVAGKGISKAINAGSNSNNKYAKAASNIARKGVNKGYELNQKYGRDIEAYQRARKVQGGIETWKRTGKLI